MHIAIGKISPENSEVKKARNHFQIQFLRLHGHVLGKLGNHDIAGDKKVTNLTSKIKMKNFCTLCMCFVLFFFFNFCTYCHCFRPIHDGK